jgi:hypothetical protein
MDNSEEELIDGTKGSHNFSCGLQLIKFTHIIHNYILIKLIVKKNLNLSSLLP